MPAKKPTELTGWNPIVRIARLQIIESLSAAQIFTKLLISSVNPLPRPLICIIKNRCEVCSEGKSRTFVGGFARGESQLTAFSLIGVPTSRTDSQYGELAARDLCNSAMRRHYRRV